MIRFAPVVMGSLICLVAVAAVPRDIGFHAGPQADGVKDLHLRKVAEYGELEPVAGDSPRDGRVFGQIAKVLESRGGAILVLDAQMMRITVLEESGSLRRVIRGGRGTGPGEFRLPTSMDVDGGRIAVYDYSLGRVTLFDSAGSVLRTVSTPRAKDIGLIGGYLFGSDMPGGRHALWRIRLSDGAQDHLLPVSDTVKRFNPRGPIARIAAYTGFLYVASGEPSIWYRGNLEERRGRYALATYQHTVWDGIPMPPGETLAIVPLEDGAVAVAYTEWQFPQRRRPFISGHWMDVYSGNGQLVARGRLPNNGLTSIAGSSDGRHLLLAEHEPFPRVVKYSIEY